MTIVYPSKPAQTTPIACRSVLLFCLATLGSAAGTGQQIAGRPVLSATPAVGASASASARAVALPSLQTAASLGADYVIAPEDTIEVTVWKEPVLSGSLPVRPDGRISLALLGDLPAAGYTPMKLADEITERLKKYVTDPRVTVSVLTVHTDKVFLMGEVGRVGAVPLTPGMTPLQAIAAGGGLGPYANGKHMYILRTVAGKPVRIPFNYKKALKSGNEQGVTLLPNDTIVAP